VNFATPARKRMNDNSANLPFLADDVKYYGDDSELLLWIQLTLTKLPIDVARFVIDRCSFVSTGRVNLGLILPGRIGVHFLERRSRNTWVIILSENLPASEEESVIAHEIAHAWLGHDRLAEMSDDVEIEAANLTKLWGFVGRGADPEYCNARFK
jgi:hypothetical protein